jgi:hypothetical protein
VQFDDEDINAQNFETFIVAIYDGHLLMEGISK